MTEASPSRGLREVTNRHSCPNLASCPAPSGWFDSPSRAEARNFASNRLLSTEAVRCLPSETEVSSVDIHLAANPLRSFEGWAPPLDQRQPPRRPTQTGLGCPLPDRPGFPVAGSEDSTVPNSPDSHPSSESEGRRAVCHDQPQRVIGFRVLSRDFADSHMKTHRASVSCHTPPVQS